MTLTKFVVCATLTLLAIFVGACTDSQSSMSCPSGMCTASCTDQAGCPAPGSCKLDSDCASDTCVAGSCVAESMIVYLAADGTDVANTSCTQNKPCASYAHAFNLDHPFLRQSGAHRETVRFPSGRQITVVAGPGASLASASPGESAMTLDDGASVTVHGLHFDGASDRGVNTIDVPESVTDTNLSLVDVEIAGSAGVGVRVASGSLTMDHCTVTDNAQGGLVVVGPTSFHIKNHSGFMRNGTPSSGQGGVWIGSSSMAGSRIEDSVVTHNYAQSGTAPGIHCVAPNTVIANSTVEDNGNGSTAQIDGTCLLQAAGAATGE